MKEAKDASEMVFIWKVSLSQVSLVGARREDPRIHQPWDRTMVPQEYSEFQVKGMTFLEVTTRV